MLKSWYSSAMESSPAQNGSEQINPLQPVMMVVQFYAMKGLADQLVFNHDVHGHMYFFMIDYGSTYLL